MNEIKYSEWVQLLTQLAGGDITGNELITIIVDGEPKSILMSTLLTAAFAGAEEKTVAEMQALASTDGLTVGQLYKITGYEGYGGDFENGTTILYFRAATTSQLENDGFRVMLCPSYYGEGAGPGEGNNWLGVWYDGLTPSTGDLAIWGGKVFRNLNGSVGASSGDTLLDGEWALIDKDDFANLEYSEMVFGCSFDLANAWISKQWDGKGNIFGGDYYTVTDNWGFNPVDISDWNHASGFNGYNFYGNEGWGFWNNRISSGQAYANKVTFGIYGNVCNALSQNVGGYLYANMITGGIYVNTGFDSINNNTNGGDIGGNLSKSIYGNSNSADITYNLTLQIYDNSNTGEIQYTNIPEISNCSNTGSIRNIAGSQGVYGDDRAGDITVWDKRIYKALLNQTAPSTATSGTLIVGEIYTLTTYVAGDDFENVANVQSGTINTTGCVFIATGTTPTAWTEGSTLDSAGNPVDRPQNRTEPSYFSVVWTRDDAGDFTGTTDAPLVNDYTTFSANAEWNSDVQVVNLSRVDSNTIKMYTSDENGALVDNFENLTIYIETIVD